MKIGDLVKWTFPGHQDYGIIVDIKNNIQNGLYGYVHIKWFLKPEQSGYYPIDGKYLEKVEQNP